MGPQSAERSAEDALSTPLPGETLAAFYSRTRKGTILLNKILHQIDYVLFFCCFPNSGEYWAGKAHGGSTNRGKMLRRDGFALAQERYGKLLFFETQGLRPSLIYEPFLILFPYLAAEYKPILEEVEKILAEAGLDEEEIKRSGAARGAGGAKGPQRERGR